MYRVRVGGVQGFKVCFQLGGVFCIEDTRCSVENLTPIYTLRVWVKMLPVVFKLHQVLSEIRALQNISKSTL